jgi:hypothetical protein
MEGWKVRRSRLDDRFNSPVAGLVGSVPIQQRCDVITCIPIDRVTDRYLNIFNFKINVILPEATVIHVSGRNLPDVDTGNESHTDVLTSGLNDRLRMNGRSLVRVVSCVFFT